jgi:hypothetical protein
MYALEGVRQSGKTLIEHSLNKHPPMTAHTYTEGLANSNALNRQFLGKRC